MVCFENTHLERNFSSSSFSTFEITSSSDVLESSSLEKKENFIPVREFHSTSDFCHSPMKKQIPRSPQKMSVLCEVTEPLTERLSEVQTKIVSLHQENDKPLPPASETPKFVDESEVINESQPVTPESLIFPISSR